MKYVYGAGALISQESSDGTGYYHYDLRGSTVALTDETGTITDRYQYDVYGQVLHTEGDSTTPFLYNGRDGVMTDGNGLLYMRARYYSPELKRFINADVLQGNIGDSDTLNRYAYVEGNPVSMVDPFGLCAEPGSKKKGSKGFFGKIKSTWHTGVRKVKSGYHTVVSGTKKFFSSWSVSDYIHTALDGLGMIPGGGAVFDGINAIYYLTEGDVMNAGMSGIALIPLVGEAAAGGKFATKTADGVGDVIKSSEKIGDAMQDTVKYVDDIADSGKYADDIAGSGKYVDEIIDGGSKSGKTTGLAQYGHDFGKMGTYVDNPNIKVDWSQYAEHGFKRMQQRGMTQEMVDQIVANGKVLSQNNGSKFAFITQDGVAVVSRDGKLITTWSSEYYDSAMQEIIIKLFGE